MRGRHSASVTPEEVGRGFDRTEPAEPRPSPARPRLDVAPTGREPIVVARAEGRRLAGLGLTGP